MGTYAEKLKSPHWQRLRLRIFERDNWTCRECGDSESELHVHHIMYIKGRQPWQYEDTNFKTLCEICHSKKHGKHFDPTKDIVPSVYVSISEAIKDLTKWFNATHRIMSIPEQYGFIREYKCKTKSPAPDAMVVISALNAIAINVSQELKAELDEDDVVAIMRKSRDLSKLTNLLSKETGITTIIRL